MMVLQGLLLLGAGGLAEMTGPRVPIAVLAALCLLLVPVLPCRTTDSLVTSRNLSG
jgi:hypothetical protein